MSDMILYSLPHSPYAARVRLMLKLKSIDAQIVAPLGGLGSEQFKALTPTGKVPALQVGELNLPESIAIMEFLEERFSDYPTLRGSDLERAWNRSASRFIDLGLAPALFPLFAQLQANPKDKALIANSLAELKKQVAVLAQFVERAPGELLDAKSPGFFDCVLAPVMFYVTTVAPLFGDTGILDSQDGLAAWWAEIQQHEQVSVLLEEMRAGLAAMMGS
ncbi:MAG: glutathione S-transferase [Bacteroidia bacterium]|jgi:glutathione S-transferase